MNNIECSLSDELELADYLTIFKLIDKCEIYCIFKGTQWRCGCGNEVYIHGRYILTNNYRMTRTKLCSLYIIKKLRNMFDFPLSSSNVIEFIHTFIPNMSSALSLGVTRYEFLCSIKNYNTLAMYEGYDVCPLMEIRRSEHTSYDILKNTVNIHKTIDILGNLVHNSYTYDEFISNMRLFTGNSNSSNSSNSSNDSPNDSPNDSHGESPEYLYNNAYTHEHSMNTKKELILYKKDEFDSLNISSVNMMTGYNHIFISKYKLDHMDISQMNNLVSLELKSCRLQKFIFNQNSHSLKTLRELKITKAGKLGSIDLSNFENLTEIKLNKCGLSEVILSPNAEDVDLGNNNISSLNVPESVKCLHLYNNRFKSFTLHNPLDTLIISGNRQLVTLNISADLRVLNANFCALKSLDVSGCEKLTELQVSKNTSMELKLCESLKILNLYKCDLDSLDGINLSPCKNLKVLKLADNNIKHISKRTLSQLEKLEYIDIHSNYIKSLNIHWNKLKIIRASWYVNICNSYYVIKASGCPYECKLHPYERNYSCLSPLQKQNSCETFYKKSLELLNVEKIITD